MKTQRQPVSNGPTRSRSSGPTDVSLPPSNDSRGYGATRQLVREAFRCPAERETAGLRRDPSATPQLPGPGERSESRGLALRHGKFRLNTPSKELKAVPGTKSHTPTCTIQMYKIRNVNYRCTKHTENICFTTTLIHVKTCNVTTVGATTDGKRTLNSVLLRAAGLIMRTTGIPSHTENTHTHAYACTHSHTRAHREERERHREERQPQAGTVVHAHTYSFAVSS